VNNISRYNWLEMTVARIIHFMRQH